MNKEVIDFRQRPLVFIDLETTGVNPLRHEILEVGCLVANGETFKKIEEYNAKVKPIHIETADPEALKINGYSPERWGEAKELKEAIERLAKIAPGGIISGWNISFDWSFLERAFANFRISHGFDYHKLDVQSIAYSKLYGKGEVKKLGLRPVASYFGIKLAEIHGAEEDIQMTYEIFKKLMKRNGK